MSHKSLAQPAVKKMLATQCDTPPARDARNPGTPSKLGRLIGEMKPVAIRMIPNFTPRHIISSPSVAAGKSGQGCTGDAGNPISPEKTKRSAATAALPRNESAPGYPRPPPPSVVSGARDDCQSLAPRHPIHAWSHVGLNALCSYGCDGLGSARG